MEKKTIQALNVGTECCSVPSLVNVQQSTLPRSNSAVTLYTACGPEEMEIYIGQYVQHVRTQAV